MPKIHFLDSIERLQEHQDYSANCGALVKSAEFPYIADQAALGRQELSGINNCHRCLAISERAEGTRYLYGMISGEEALAELRGGSL